MYKKVKFGSWLYFTDQTDEVRRIDIWSEKTHEKSIIEKIFMGILSENKFVDKCKQYNKNYILSKSVFICIVKNIEKRQFPVNIVRIFASKNCKFVKFWFNDYADEWRKR